MRHSQLARRAATAGVCIGVGAAAGIAGSAAAPAKPAGSSKSAKARNGRAASITAGSTTAPAPPGFAAVKIGLGGPPVHSVDALPNKAGDGFDTITDDSGTVKSVSGQSVTITEGTDKATYATPTLTIPPDADVQRNFAAATLGDVQAGDHIDVSADSDGTTSVMAFDPQHWPPKPSSIVGCGKPGALPVPPRVGTTTGQAAGIVVRRAKFAARAKASAATVNVAGATGAGGVVSATVVGPAGPGGPAGGVVCSFTTP